MEIFSSFVNSLMLPKKKAVLNINKMKVGSSVAYFAIFIILITLPDIMKILLNDHSDFSSVPEGVFIFQILVFYPLESIFFGLIGISLVAAIGMLMNKLTGRRLKYALLWKMALHASTTPLLLYTVVKNIFAMNSLISAVLFLLVFFLLYRMITVFPKPHSK